jgi:hypothetical protein
MDEKERQHADDADAGCQSHQRVIVLDRDAFQNLEHHTLPDPRGD